MEMKNKFVDHARNLWDRAVIRLPRPVQDRFLRGGCRTSKGGCLIKFELRYNETERAREIFERFVHCLPKVGAWIRFAKFEMKNGEIGRARNCYERAVDKLAMR
ncbi:hypothetical protein H5410_016971 [Solanum commersonii]|uniref:Crooked neck-like protein 1 n=1 Tax=Solanum commersonii TaxID=4109 RepID=A0A9J5ZYJ6_SOLCO|nr:hypothetical protein H5410_016971 [Solanum commersonii]